MEIHQFSCREENEIDLRQANALIRHKPDIVFWEAPSNKNSAKPVFDPNESIRNLETELKERMVNLKRSSGESPWIISDITAYENTIKLLKDGHRVRMYSVDAPSELLHETIIHKWNTIDKPRNRGRHILWWIYIYLRERIMANNIKPLLKNKNQKALMFMQKFHWLHVKFLLSEPTKDEIWKYYFAKFENVDKKNILEIIKTKNATLYKYWLKHSDFI